MRQMEWQSPGMSQLDDHIHVFRHAAMATHWQVRIADQDPKYAAQAAQTCFEEVNRLERLLSRFRTDSEISHIAQLGAGDDLILNEATFAVLTQARDFEAALQDSFSISAAQGPGGLARWELDAQGMRIRCKEAPLKFDLGAIGKGFALDRCAEILHEWDVSAYLLVSGGSSVLAGGAPGGMAGWNVGLADEGAKRRWWLSHGSLSGSGLTVRGRHILNPKTGEPGDVRPRAWCFGNSAAMTDAFSTAAMLLPDDELALCMDGRSDIAIALNEPGGLRIHGGWPMPMEVV